MAMTCRAHAAATALAARRDFQDIVGKYNHRGYDPRVYAEHWVLSLNDRAARPSRRIFCARPVSLASASFGAQLARLPAQRSHDRRFAI